MSYEIGAAALGTIGNLMGMGMQNQTTEAMMNQQMQNQMVLNNQMQDIQQQNWDYTNFENQRKHLENAGLNAGLLYGMSGGGGTTMGGASGGSAASGQAAHAPNFMEVAQQMLQAKAIESQIEVNKATANEKNANADSTRGVEGTKGEADIKEIASRMGVNASTVEKIAQEIEGGKQNIKESASRIKLNEEQANRLNQITPYERKLIEAEGVREITKNQYLNDRERKELNLISKQAFNYIREQQLKAAEIDIHKFKAELERQMPGISSVLGRLGNGAINAILGIMTGHMNEYIDYKP